MALISSSMLGPVCERVINAFHKEYSLLRDVKEEIKNLAFTMSLIKGVLQDAERKQVENVSVSIWLQELKQILFDAEDVLDEVATYEALQRTDASASISATTSKRQKVCSNIIIPSLPGGGIWFSHQIAQKIKDIRKKIDFISDEKDKLGLLMLVESRSSEIRTRGRLETSSLLGNEPHIIARDVEMKKIERLLLESAEGSENVHVIAVVGMGGVGKTTLVKHAYNNPAVSQCFELKMWVCISNDFDLKRITKEIMDAVCTYEEAKEFNETSNWDVAQKCLQDKIKGKRFLLVLDDVWEKSHSKWENLCKPLMCGGKGSKIIVTTRSQEVANIVEGTPISLKGLSSEDLWPIFERYAFGNNDPNKHRNLVHVGRQIVEKLKGLPLAAKTIGRLLNTNLDVKHWRNVLKAKAWTSLPQSDEDNILEVLKLSYDYLPGYLKQCFAYCSIFPEDHYFDKDKLVQLWMAQQFIEHHGESNVGGDEYFNGLVHASLLEPYMDKDGYVMHDLVQNLAEHISKDDCFRIEGKNFKGNSKTIRYVSIVTKSFDSKKLNELCEFENTRILLFFHGCSFQLDHLDDLFKKLQRLRVLELTNCKIKELPESIGTLKHLRYLDLYDTLISKLPESLCKLINLQVLNLGACFLDAWPENMSALINLRHLYAYDELVSSIQGLGKLTALQELVFDCRRQKMKELADMDMLRQLRIWSLEEVKSKEEASESRLDKKEYLDVLEMRWGNKFQSGMMVNPELEEEVLQSLKPASNTRELTVRNYGGIRSPGWMDDQLWLFSSSLERVELHVCLNWEVLPPLGQLPYLKFLQIRGMDKVRRMGPEFMGCCYADGGVVQVPGFPLLEELEFWHMGEWEEWEAPQQQCEYGIINDGKDDRRQKQPWQQQPPPRPQQQIMFLPCLRVLQIQGCPKLWQLPPLPPTLTILWMTDVGLTHLPGWLPSSSISSPALSYLHIEGCPNLTSLTDGLPESLRGLSIHGCPALQERYRGADWPLISHIKELDIEWW